MKIDTNTIIFFTSDNGPHDEGGAKAAFFNGSGPLRGIKRSMYEGGIRVPMIVRWPGQIKAGTVSDFPWAFWDFLPTAAEIAGCERQRCHRASMVNLCFPPCSAKKRRRTNSFTGNSTREVPSKRCGWAIGKQCDSRSASRSNFTI
jgi:arylsulfatase A-like enzyme